MKELIIDGQAYPIHFGLRALNDFAKKTGADFNTVITTAEAVGTLDALASLTALGLNEGARIEGIDERYTEDEVWDWFDENPKLVLEVADIFKESIDALTKKLGDIAPEEQD